MEADFFIRRGRRARRVSMQCFAVFAIFALENDPTILAIQLVRCNDSDFASKVERDMKADFFNAEGAELAEFRCSPLRSLRSLR